MNYGRLKYGVFFGDTALFLAASFFRFNVIFQLPQRKTPLARILSAFHFNSFVRIFEFYSREIEQLGQE